MIKFGSLYVFNSFRTIRFYTKYFRNITNYKENRKSKYYEPDSFHFNHILYILTKIRLGSWRFKSFVVEGKEGPLEEGEFSRAATWAKGIQSKK